MKKVLYILIPLGLITAIVIFLWPYFQDFGAEAVRFEGTITNLYSSCYSDGTCGIQINNECAVIMQHGGFGGRGEVGKISGMNFAYPAQLQSYIGKKVEVFAKRTNEPTFMIIGKQPACLLTLYGSPRYYVKVLN